MKTKHFPSIALLFFGCFLGLLFSIPARCQQNAAPAWQAKSLPFRVLNITSTGTRLWICGADESIALSDDGGETWQIKHRIPDGGVLLNIAFANESFGYAAGSNGMLLVTQDAGATWSRHSAGSEPILQLSFADPQHGLIRTFGSLLFTVDGQNWAVVSESKNAQEIARFPYTFSLVALDSTHMAVMTKAGPNQANAQAFLTTGDAGKTWQFVNIPNVTLYSFLRVQGNYWAVGTEVIHKDQPGGGYAVPVALYSSDGQHWEHTDQNLSSCKPHLCTGCTDAGCFSANGTITDFFSGKTVYKEFQPNQELNTKWAATATTICFVTDELKCSSLKPVASPTDGNLPIAPAVAAGALGAPPAQQPRCILCAMDRILIDKKAQGSYTIKLTLEISKNGVVKSAVAEGAPTADIKARVEAQALQWMFEPYLKDGVNTAVKLNTRVQINAIRAR